MRIGTGFDVHLLVEGRKLMLGGVHIPYKKGLLGHSDADCVLHALCDALLGAAGMGDIGQHFPDTDPQWEGVSSRIFLDTVHRKLQYAGFTCVNVDTIIVADAPKLSGHYEQMKLCISDILQISPDCVGVKSTRTEGVLHVDTKEAIAAHAVCLLQEQKSVGTE